MNYKNIYTNIKCQRCNKEEDNIMNYTSLKNVAR